MTNIQEDIDRLRALAEEAGIGGAGGTIGIADEKTFKRALQEGVTPNELVWQVLASFEAAMSALMDVVKPDDVTDLVVDALEVAVLAMNNAGNVAKREAARQSGHPMTLDQLADVAAHAMHEARLQVPADALVVPEKPWTDLTESERDRIRQPTKAMLAALESIEVLLVRRGQPSPRMIIVDDVNIGEAPSPQGE